MTIPSVEPLEDVEEVVPQPVSAKKETKTEKRFKYEGFMLNCLIFI